MISIDIIIGFVSSGLLGLIVFVYYYSKVIKKESYFKDKIKELYYENILLHEKLEHQRDIKEEFKTISNQTILNSQTDFKYLLQPFEHSINKFNKDIESYYIDEAKERFHLTREIQNLHKLNSELSQEANRLTTALKSDNKFQGSWGEFILESILERSGLRVGFEYEVQKDFLHDNTHYRPDVIVHLPNNKDIIIDSKVSLKDYEVYVNDSDKKALKKHIESINSHVKNLSSKAYQKLSGVDTIDLVLLFIPIESAYITAMSEDIDLFDKAYKKNIILVSPTTLITVLKTIEYSWKGEYQNKNAKDIAKKASSLYDKFQSFLLDMQGIDNSLKKAQTSYDSAYKKLSSGNANLMKQTRELKEMENIFEIKD